MEIREQFSQKDLPQMFDWVPLFGNIKSSENKKIEEKLKDF